MTIRIFVAALAAASLLSGAALAEQQKTVKKKKRPAVHTEQVEHNARLTPDERAHGRDPYAVFYGGTYVGRDPDPSVRMMMQRDQGLDNQ